MTRIISTQYDCLIKMVLIGDSDVGKTAFFDSFLYNKQKSSSPTIGVDFGFKTLLLNDKTIKVQLWDTAGQERFRSITQNYYRGSDIVVIMYDITNRKTFDNIDLWYNNIKIANNDNKPYYILLIGNKVDLEEKREITTEKGKEIAIKYGMSFMEISCFDFNNINLIINTAVENTLKIKTDIISSLDRAKSLTNIEHSDNTVKVIHVTVVEPSKKSCCY